MALSKTAKVVGLRTVSKQAKINKGGITKGSRYIANCRGSYVCSNFKCEIQNILGSIGENLSKRKIR